MKDNKFQIQLMNNIASVGIDVFDADRYECSDKEENPDGIMVRSAKMNDMEFGSNLLCIARAGIGVNNIPVERCADEGIVVFNTPGANANAVKELALCALLLSSRKVSDGIEWAKTLKGTEGVAAAVEKGKGAYVGPELFGKKLGVIGLGHIGAIIANTAEGIGMEVSGVDPYLTIENALVLNSTISRVANFSDIYENSDYITLHVPLNDGTRGMINAETISKMKDGVRIINLSRGELVDDDAMAAALESGKVACYVTDFPNEKTLEMKNAVCIPHLGASTPESEDNCAVMAAKQAQDFIDFGIIKNSVNFPNIDMPFETACRVVVLHRNVSGIIGNISSTFAAEGINIEHMENRSRKEYAVTICDSETMIPEFALAHIASSKDILKVRLIKK